MSILLKVVIHTNYIAYIKSNCPLAIADLKRLMISVMFGRILVLSVTLQVLLSNFSEIRVLSTHCISAQSNEIWSTLWGIVVEKVSWLQH